MLDAFVPHDEGIVEVVFKNEVMLARSTERAASYDGPCEPLYRP
jgi:hypothetical protein